MTPPARYAVLGGTDHALFIAAAISGRTGSEVPVGVDREVRITELRDEVAGEQVAVDVRATDTPEADAYVLAADAADLLEVLTRHAQLISGRPVLLIAPGVGGAALAHDWFAEAGLESPTLAETNANPFAGKVDRGTVTIRAVKRALLAGDLAAPAAPRGEPGSPAAPASDLIAPATSATHVVPPPPAAADVFAPALGELVAATAIESSLANTNHVLHPAMTLANLTRIDSGAAFTLFREGMSPATERLIHQTDDERGRLAAALGAQYTPVLAWFERFYGDQGCRGDSLVVAFSNFPAFATAPGPTTLHHRFITDDVRCGLAVLERLGQQLGVPTPVTTATIEALASATGEDLRTGAQARADALLSRGRAG